MFLCQTIVLLSLTLTLLDMQTFFITKDIKLNKDILILLLSILSLETYWQV